MNYKSFKHYFLLALVAPFIFASCSDDDVPEAENEEEVINEIILTFTPSDNSDVVTAKYYDADGDGTQAPTIDTIKLSASTNYVLSLQLLNTVTEDEEDITEEINEESDAHMFFFGWTSNLFTNPTGNGNLGDGNRENPLNYLDKDVNELPVGLITSWTTAEASAKGTFNLVLKHQPNLKSATTTSEDGESDVNITLPISIN